MDKNENKNLLDDKKLDKVTGAKMTRECPVDGGDHKWDNGSAGEYFRTCVKCGQCGWVIL